MSINKSKNQFIEELIIERLPDPKINDIKNLCYFPFSQESNLSLVDIYKAWQEFFNKVDYQNFNYNLYLHVPFCRSKCLYCNYYSLVEPSKESRLIYLKNLANQLKFLAPLFKNIKFSSIFLGGGTPSYLADKELMFCLDLIHQNLNFKNHIRKAFEVNPKDLNYNKLLLLKKYKFNEISMGVQSLNEKVLSKNNRQYQSYDKIKKNIDLIKKLEFPKLNIDLLLGLYGDNAKTFLNTLEQIFILDPDNVVIYLIMPTKNYLNLYFNSDLNKYNKFKNDLIEDIISDYKKLLKKYGFIAKNNLDKNLSSEVILVNSKNINQEEEIQTQEDEEYYDDFSSKKVCLLGLGSAARSYIYSLMKYKQAVKFDSLSFRGYRLINNEDTFKYLLKNIFENQAIDLLKFKKMFNQDFTELFTEEINDLIKNNKMQKTNNQLKFKYKDIKDLFATSLYFLPEDAIRSVMHNFKTNL